jgi:hypothetical protein
VTGLTLANDETIPKQIQLLKEAVPAIANVGFIKTRFNAVTQEIAEIGAGGAVRGLRGQSDGSVFGRHSR